MEYSKTKRWTTTALLVLGGCTLGSGVLSYGGLREDSTTLIALIRTLASIVASYIFWKFLYLEFPKATSKKSKRLMLIGVAIATPVIAVLSSYYSICGMASKRAQKYELEQILASATDKLDEILALRKKELSIRGHIVAAEKAFALHGRTEARHGTVSKKWRRGPVASSLRTLSKGFADLVKQIDEQESRIEKLKGRGHGLLTEIRNIIDNEELDIKLKRSSVQKRLNNYNDTLFELSNSSITANVGSLVEQIDGLYFINQGEDVENALREPIEKSKRLVADSISALDGHHVVLERYRTLSGTDAIIKHFHRILPSMASSLVLDFGLPAMLLLILSYLNNRNSATQEISSKGDENVHYKTTGTENTSIKDMLSLLDSNRNGSHKQQTG